MKKSIPAAPAARPYLRAFYRNNRARFTLAFLLTALSFPEAIVDSWLLGAILDCVAAADLARLGRLTVFAAVFLAAMSLCKLGMYRVRASFLQRALVQYKSLAFRRLSEKSIRAFTREHTGRYLSVLTSDTGTVEEQYLDHAFLMLYHTLVLLGSLAMMFRYSPALTFAALLLTALPLVSSLLMGPRLARLEKAVSDEHEHFTARLKDLLSGFGVLKSFKAEAEAQRIFDEADSALEGVKFRRRRWNALLLTVSQSLCAGAMQFGVFLLGAFLAIRGEITAGTVLIFTNLCNFVIQPVTLLPQYWAERKAARGLIDKLAQVTAENAGREGEAIPPVLREGILLDRVSFGYEPERPVLREISLRLEPGKKYAVVGGSGAGKSTLLDLLMGAHDQYEGSVTVDGKELRSISTDSLYDLIGRIDQNVFLFDDTLRRNITMFRDVPDARLQDAAARAGLAGLLAQKGEDYRCGENGAALSGGERQRVSIARCLLRGAPVLLLDEATASLDEPTAFAITDAILRLEGLTRVVVTHRLNETLLAQYDEILMLQNGRICERGSFARLMACKGRFYSLYTLSA